MKRKVDTMNEKPQITALPADKLLSTAEVAEVLGGTDVGFVNRIINCELLLAINEFVREYAGRDIVAEVDRIELEKMRKKKKLQHSKEMREFARGLAEHAELTHFIRGLDIDDEDEGRLF